MNYRFPLFSAVAFTVLLLAFGTLPVRAATFNVNCDVTELITAINTANATSGDDIIDLASGCTYTLTVVNNTASEGANGLPAIVASATGGALTINGNGATIARDTTAVAFRLFYLNSASNLILNDLTLTGGHGSSGNTMGGGAIFNNGTLTINRSTLMENTVTGASDYVHGGAIRNEGILNISQSTLRGNSVVGNNAYGSAIRNGSGTLTISHSSIRENLAAGTSLAQATISGSGTISISYSTISSNTVTSDASSSSGGLYISTGTLTVLHSTFSNNVATGTSTGASGGGILNVRAAATIVNSTISGNQVSSAGSVMSAGLGVGHSTGSATVINSTITGNSAITTGTITGASVQNAGTLTVQNSIIANNTGGDCGSTGTLNGAGANYIADGGCTPVGGTLLTEAINGPILLGPLSNNGGATQTHALQSGSPAIDVGDNTICAAAPVSGIDQRGTSRPQDGDGDGTAHCDLGAVERMATPSTPVNDSASSPPETGPQSPVDTFVLRNIGVYTSGVMTSPGNVQSVGMDGTTGEVYFQIIAQNGTYATHSGTIGQPDIIAQGVVQAVTVFGLLPGGVPSNTFSGSVEVCLNGNGSVYFIQSVDGAVVLLPVVARGSALCVTIQTAGILVLVGTANLNPATALQTDMVAQLANCMVETRSRVNLRDNASFGDNVVLVIGYDTASPTLLTALERRGDWYRVDYLGTQGWLNASVVMTQGICG